MHERYGDVVRIAPRHLSYANAVAWKDVWGHRQGHAEFPKANVPPPVNGVQGILLADREPHSRYRRAFAHAFSASGLREQEPRINQYVTMLLDGVYSHDEGHGVDLVEWFNWMTFDLIGDLAFGESFGCLQHARTHPWIANVFGNIASSVWVGAAQDLGLRRILPFVIPRRLMEARMENYKFASEKIAARTQLGTERGDFFDKVVAKELGEGGMTRREMESNASALVLAGSETTATMLAGTTALLLQHPDVLKKLTSHIRGSFESEESITVESCSRDSYLLAVLNESMRIYPPVPNFAIRSVPSPGDVVGGTFLPVGTMIEFCHFAAYRLEDNFVDADKFIPERWMGDPRFQNDNKAVFEPFSYGPRNCIGRNLAYAESRLALTRLLWRYDLALSTRTQQLDAWIERQKTAVLWQKVPLIVRMTPRSIS